MKIPRRLLFGKLSPSLFKALEAATVFAKLRGNPYVELAHCVHQLWQTPGNDLHKLVSHHGIRSEQITQDIIAALSKLTGGADKLIDFSQDIEKTIEQSWIFTSLSLGAGQIRSGFLIATTLSTPDLRIKLLDISPEFAKIRLGEVADNLMPMLAGSTEDQDVSGWQPDGTPGEASQAMASEQDGKPSALGSYCTDLTALARQGRIDPVIGRENEIRTMVDILLRRRQNNPLLTGDAGVGKTAVIEGLALAITQGRVPPALVGIRLLSLDVGALLAGASMRGEFESRLKKVLQEAGESAQPVILFVDEIHTLVGAGGQAGTGDAANLLKPALARGNLRTIGATTWSEYKRHIEKDPALTRRFQVLQVLEPQEAQAIAMVRGLVPTLRKHHQVVILDEAVRAAVKLSRRYIPSRQLPDKAISLLDTACARVAMSRHALPPSVEQLAHELSVLRQEATMLADEVAIGRNTAADLQLRHNQIAVKEAELGIQRSQFTQEKEALEQLLALREQQLNAETDTDPNTSGITDELRRLEQNLAELQGEHPKVYPHVDEGVIARIVESWTGIPVGRMVSDDLLAVLDLEQTLSKRVVGQPGGLMRIAERVKTARAGLTDPSKPLGTFLLVGPSGVGKTETAMALAQAMYGGEASLITINMSEYQEAHTVSSLKGAPPGYVGYGQGGVLTEAVRRRPYSVILLDEVEKAHPDVHEVFYQVFDKGWMEDGEGRVIDFKNTLILLTSNTGSELISELCEDPALIPEPAALVKALEPELRKVFPAAFLGRLCIVPYTALATEVLQDITQLQLDKLAARMREQHNIDLRFAAEIRPRIVAQCGVHETGARRIAQYLEQNISPVLAHLWLEAMEQKTVLKRIEVTATPADASASGLTHFAEVEGLFFSIEKEEVDA